MRENTSSLLERALIVVFLGVFAVLGLSLVSQHHYITAEDVHWSADDPTVPQDPPPAWTQDPKVIDLAAKPTASVIWMALPGSDYRVDEHNASRPRFVWDEEKVSLYQMPAQTTRKVSGTELLRGVHHVDSPNANMLDWLLAHQEAIPEYWKDKTVIFGGTVYRTPKVLPIFYFDEPLSFFRNLAGTLAGTPVVRAMYCNSSGCGSTWYCLNEEPYFGEHYYIAAFN